MENPTKMDALGVPLFSETPIYTNQALRFSTTFFSTNLYLGGLGRDEVGEFPADAP